VLAQRLVRRICPACTESVALDAGIQAALGLTPGDLARAARGRGCADCRGTGFRGRTGIYERLGMNDEIRAELPRLRSAGELRRLAVAAGMRTLRDDGVRLVREGVTTAEEVLRVTGR